MSPLGGVGEMKVPLNNLNLNNRFFGLVFFVFFFGFLDLSVVRTSWFSTAELEKSVDFF